MTVVIPIVAEQVFQSYFVIDIKYSIFLEVTNLVDCSHNLLVVSQVEKMVFYKNKIVYS